jgi:hypothetical protein
MVDANLGHPDTCQLHLSILNCEQLNAKSG